MISSIDLEARIVLLANFLIKRSRSKMNDFLKKCMINGNNPPLFMFFGLKLIFAMLPN